jgi:4-hydroxybenzoate polyprenyltransferase
MITGMVAAGIYGHVQFNTYLLTIGVLALFIACLTSSVNYITNEIIDAQFDFEHPLKKTRPIPSGIVTVKKLVYLNIYLSLSILVISYLCYSKFFFYTVFAFFLQGVLYNVPPIRGKDLPVFDVILESVNNPIRLLLGWYAILPHIHPPILLIACYWFFGAYLMNVKRFAEYRFLGKEVALRYRIVFKYYSEIFLGILNAIYSIITIVIFVMIALNYKATLLYSFPFIIVFFIWFSILAFQKNSIVKEPERIMEKKAFFTYSLFTFLFMILTLFL